MIPAASQGPAWTSKQVSAGPVECRLCGERDWNRFLHEEKGYHILQCPACGFITTDPIPTDDELARFYSETYHQGAEEQIDFWEKPRRPVFAQVESLLRAAGFEKHARVLDVGCAYGAFLRFLHEHGYTSLTGLDLSRSAVDHINANTDFEGVCGDITRAGLEDGSRDVITFLDTLEHLPNFRDCMAAAARALAPGGVVVVRVPNMNFHVAKTRLFQHMQWRPPYGMFTPPGHLNHFTPGGMSALLAGVGLRECGRHNGEADLVRSRKRILFLQGLRVVSEALRVASGGSLLIGHSMIFMGRKASAQA